MAFAKRSSSVEEQNGGGFNRYIGIDQFTMIGVNPTLAQLNEWGIQAKKEPEYTFIDDDGTKGIRLAFWMRSKTFADFICRVEYRLRNKKNEATRDDGTKSTQMIDVCGNVAWLTDDEIKAKMVPTTKKGTQKPFIPAGMRPCRSGESELTMFLKAYNNVADSHRYKDGVWKAIDNPEEQAAARLDKIANYFSGDISEITGMLCENTVQILVGVRSDEDGKMLQEIYTDRVCRARTNQAAEVFKKEIARRKSSGKKNDQYLHTCEFSFDPIKIWSVEPSSSEEIKEAGE